MNTTKIQKMSERYNVLLRRREIAFTIDHPSSGTPQVYEVREALASSCKVKPEVVYITKLNTQTGTNQTVGWAEVYDEMEQASRVTPKHVQLRNLPPRERRERLEKARKVR
ncbi:MAG: hypothetical protein ACE5Z5_13655, partial [Candidatus Bathyarchaeia archaeon]